MIKDITFENWKSFDKATLYLDPLTVLIGTNASGKSNALDALAFLNRLAMGKDIKSSLIGDMATPPIRGGVEWSVLQPHTEFTLSVTTEGSSDNIEYIYSITIQTAPVIQLKAESLTQVKYRIKTKSHPSSLYLYKTDPVDDSSPVITSRLYNESKGRPQDIHRSSAALVQISDISNRKEIVEGIKTVLKALRNIFVLDPIPSNMREYSPLSDVLLSDAKNIAGVLAALPEDRKTEVEQVLTQYSRHLPERDIRRIWAETVGRFNSDAMLYCEEEWTDEQYNTVDARGMSDGTLRYLAILTALMVRPEYSQLIIEEVDNGLHPSRAGELLRMLKEIGSKRHIDVLITTHNPALLDVMGPEMVPFVVVANRDPQSGNSRLTLLEDIENLPKLLASGPLGKLSSRGDIEESLQVPLELVR